MGKRMTPKEVREAALRDNYSQRKGEKMQLVINGLPFLGTDTLDEFLVIIRDRTGIALEEKIKTLE